ncbi:2-C-methyl-D-erythritol 4-phosphate cytidylyltransferase [Rosistilla carotiformis]|uniref:2-C-methyl-D-erythritol 4-phosphate cytidylyltransferase n=1 Tax=Rosistilla carotiformis TaxID=2528017 RepID=A0A518JT93_9BACT|nr:2-C-methyl-D-erythritol 4-phosphate cytidylyltransferase [Rosistilla carotiformis]QDV68767.1 2-C-methyl-D-erythritol 4-phosphate cytidylyltransferase [Rosistilla carotiformis]
MQAFLEPGSVAVIFPAAGTSRRFGGPQSKIFASLAGHPVWWHAAQRLRAFAEVGQIVIAIHPDDRPRWESEFSEAVSTLGIDLVDGGSERYESVLQAIARIDCASYIAVHDAARPLVPNADLQRLFVAAASHDAVMLATPVRGTIKRANVESIVQTTVDRSRLWEAQTPQLFRRQLLVDAYARWRGWPVTDDASLVERAGGKVHLVEGSPLNLKITSPDDLLLAEAIIQSR